MGTVKLGLQCPILKPFRTGLPRPLKISSKPLQGLDSSLVPPALSCPSRPAQFLLHFKFAGQFELCQHPVHTIRLLKHILQQQYLISGIHFVRCTKEATTMERFPPTSIPSLFLLLQPLELQGSAVLLPGRYFPECF